MACPPPHGMRSRHRNDGIAGSRQGSHPGAGLSRAPDRGSSGPRSAVSDVAIHARRPTSCGLSRTDLKPCASATPPAIPSVRTGRPGNGRAHGPPTHRVRRPRGNDATVRFGTGAHALPEVPGNGTPFRVPRRGRIAAHAIDGTGGRRLAFARARPPGAVSRETDATRCRHERSALPMRQARRPRARQPTRPAPSGNGRIASDRARAGPSRPTLRGRPWPGRGARRETPAAPG